MNKGRNFWVIAMCATLLIGCKAKTICPAYQSAFLLDEESQLAFFSYFQDNEEEEFEATGITDIHHDRSKGVDTTGFETYSEHEPKDPFVIKKSPKNGNGISSGPTVKPKKSYKKRHYVVPMKDVYVERADSVVNLADSVGTEYRSVGDTAISTMDDF